MPDPAPSTAPPSAPRRQRWLRAGWILGFLVLALLALRTFVAGIYRVDSGSMEPLIHGAADGGERVLVRYDRRPPLARFDLVVFVRPGQESPVVKRAGGLPGESVLISGGDLFIGGRRLGPDVPRPEPVELFDSRRHAFRDAFRTNYERPGDFEGAAWNADATGIGPDLPEIVAQWSTRLLDGYVDRDGEPVRGVHEIGDAGLEADLRVEAPDTRLSLRLTEDGDRFDLDLVAGAEGGRATLTRHSADGRGGQTVEVLAERDLALTVGASHRIAFSNVDNALRVELDGDASFLTATYLRNEPLTGVPDPSYVHLKPRVELAVQAGVVVFERVRLVRDLHYTAQGRYGIVEPEQLGPDEIFVLGDNSSESQDSRAFGPVSLDQVVGVPVMVVWPPSGLRWLEGARAPSGGSP